jgi:Cu(I)/Ag(I) efflux system membrane protein CusA/SilA
LKWCLANKWKFLSLPIALVLFGIITWQGFEKVFGFLPSGIKSSTAYHNVSMAFPGIGKEFMPALDEGSFLLMPTTMPHSGVEENLEVIKLLDKRINTIPEVESVVGKWGRVNSALDPAPISMFENIINYKPEYIINEDGKRLTFKTNRGGAFF